jgi:hypothetical protein
MEKMESPLSGIVPELLKHSKASQTIDFGPVAVQLLKCVQAIQDRKHLVIDIKPENFMFSSSGSTARGAGSAATKLASRIRILDLALVQPWTSIGSHRSNDGTPGVVGTPLYASLNLHNGETPSRRDDLEALGYVIAELVMKLASGDASAELPWRGGKSDDEIGKLKLDHVNNINSDFYNKLGGPSVVKIMKEYLDTVRTYPFKKTPDYDDLATLLSKIKVPHPKVHSSRKTPPSATKAATDSTANKRITRSRARALDDTDGDESSPQKVARDDSYMETEETPHARLPSRGLEPAKPMDWEPIMDENEHPGTDLHHTVGLTIIVDGGPHKGIAVNLIQGRCEAIVVGRKPTAKAGEAILALPDDAAMDDTHVRIELSVTKKLTGINVKDLKSTGGSFVGNEKIRSGNSMKIYRGDALRIGASSLRVKNLDAVQVGTAPRSKKATAGLKMSTDKSKTDKPVEIVELNEDVTPLQRQGVRICIVDGPHTGESYELEHGISASVDVGSNPSGKAGGIISLKRDGKVKANHVQIELDGLKKIKAVVVTDKSKGATKVNRDTIKKARAFINDRIHVGDSVLEIKSL